MDEQNQMAAEIDPIAEIDCRYKLSEKNARLEELSRKAIRAVYREAELREERRLLDRSQEGATP
jgi:hypothetical protein